MSRILITGAAGFIGSHTTDLLLQAGQEVTGIDNLRTGHLANLKPAMSHPSFRLLQEDMTRPDLLVRVMRHFKPEAIIHLAALVSVPESLSKPNEHHRLNVLAPQLVAAAARETGTRRIIFASSAAVYGNNPDLPLREGAGCLPLSPYGVAKLGAERLFMNLASETGIIVRCLRYFNVFGPRQDPSSPYSGVISIFEKALRENRPPLIHGDGEQTRDFIHVADVVRANVLAATAAGITSGVANICTGRAVSLNLLLATMSQVWGNNLPATHGPAREGDIRHSLGSPACAMQELGFVATVPLEDGLRRMA